MNLFDSSEFNDICKSYNLGAYEREVEIKYSNSSFYNKMKKSIKKDRRGEVVFCVIRPNNKIIAVTCSEYPEGVFRIPTGGIMKKENIIEAVFRETKEELGLEVEIEKFIGVLKIKFLLEGKDLNQEESTMFYSYMFILNEKSGNLLDDASDDEVSEIRELDIKDAEKMLGILNNITGKWADWGRFRYETSSAIINHLKHNGRLG